MVRSIRVQIHTKDNPKPRIQNLVSKTSCINNGYQYTLLQVNLQVNTSTRQTANNY